MRRLSAWLFPLLILWLQASGALGAGPGPLAPTPAERAARPSIERIEADIRFLEAKLKGRQSPADAASREAARLAGERAELEARAADLAVRASGLLPALWDMEMRLKGLLDAGVAPWDEVDREAAWTGAVAAAAGGVFAELAAKQGELSRAMAQQAALGPEALARAEDMAALKDRLLAERLKLAAQLDALRGRNPTPRERLERIVELTLRDGLSPVSFADKPLSAFRGQLARPVEGESAWSFDPGASPPRDGLGFRAPEGAPVSAAHWGRVAFAGDVPGLGRVVVLAHGGGAASVYCGLSRVSVLPGQDAERGARLGDAGRLWPDGPSGMCFELRFGLKPINPSRWLPAG